MKPIIKKLFIGIIFLPLLTNAHAPLKKDTTQSVECLKVTGLVLDEKNYAVDGVEVRLFKQNDELEQIEITSVEHHDHNFSFTLEANEYYTVKVSKPGFVERWVVFYTTLPENVSFKSLFNFEFEVVLFKEKKMDDYYLDFPIGIIHYNEKSKSFESSIEYTNFIKSKIKEAEEDANQKNDPSKKTVAK
ncbi:MAG: hypothetical protein V4677_06755 [Bacteroidota bacterium]